jgi:hypothetical protein
MSGRCKQALKQLQTEKIPLIEYALMIFKDIFHLYFKNYWRGICLIIANIMKFQYRYFAFLHLEKCYRLEMVRQEGRQKAFCGRKSLRTPEQDN